MSKVQNTNRGPFVLQSDGSMSDFDIWNAEMDADSERQFDQYMLIKAVGEAAKKELAIREGQQAFESLMDDLKKY